MFQIPRLTGKDVGNWNFTTFFTEIWFVNMILYNTLSSTPINEIVG